MDDQVRSELEDRIRHELPHLSDEEVRSLTGIVERLIDAYQPERVYLFGSKARGDYGPDSDFDLLVVVPDTAPDDRKRSRLAYDRLWGSLEVDSNRIRRRLEWHPPVSVDDGIQQTVDWYLHDRH